MRVGIALGSNLGDRVERLQQAVAALRQRAEPPVLTSRIYETEPVDCPPGSPRFLNAAVELGFSGSLDDLLAWLQNLEKEANRPVLRAKNAPRTVDLDVIYADDLVRTTPALTVPHPRAMERLFVLVPFCDICPTRLLPGFALSFEEQVDRIMKENVNTTLITAYIL